MHYNKALLTAFAILGMTVTANTEARFWSGDFTDCNKTTWNEAEQLLASTPRNTDVNLFAWSKTCIKDQPIASDNPGPRNSVWVPGTDEPFCLVMSEEDGCPKKPTSEYMSGTTMNIEPDRRSLAIPGAFASLCWVSDFFAHSDLSLAALSHFATFTQWLAKLHLLRTYQDHSPFPKDGKQLNGSGHDVRILRGK